MALTDAQKARRIRDHQKRIIGAVLITRIASQNVKTPTVTYGIFLGSDNLVYCGCEAWKYAPNEFQNCKHLDEFRAALKEMEK